MKKLFLLFLFCLPTLLFGQFYVGGGITFNENKFVTNINAEYDYNHYVLESDFNSQKRLNCLFGLKYKEVTLSSGLGHIFSNKRENHTYSIIKLKYSFDIGKRWKIEYYMMNREDYPYTRPTFKGWYQGFTLMYKINNL